MKLVTVSCQRVFVSSDICATYTGCFVTVWLRIAFIHYYNVLETDVARQMLQLTWNAATVMVNWQTVGIPKELYFPQTVLCFSSKAYSTDLHSVPLIMSRAWKLHRIRRHVRYSSRALEHSAGAVWCEMVRTSVLTIEGSGLELRDSQLSVCVFSGRRN